MDTLYDITKYTENELLQILDLDHPTDRELEAKIIQLLDTYKNSPKIYNFFQQVYRHFFDIEFEEDEDEEDVDEIEETQEGFENPAPNTTYEVPNIKEPVQPNNDVQYQTQINFPKGATNPILKETIQRVITIDSQFRDIGVYPFSTDFTFNLSETLNDVVSMKLYSVQIPYTWYTINNGYGSNFFYIKGNSPGLTTGAYDYKIEIASGNYQISDITKAISNSMQSIIQNVSDISFGKTDISYNSVNGRASFILDIYQIYNEYAYYLEFPNVIPPQIDIYYIQFVSTPYLYFKTEYPCDSSNLLINDISINIPPPYLDSYEKSVLYYGYNGTDLVNMINYQLYNTPATSQSQVINKQAPEDPSYNNTFRINIQNVIPRAENTTNNANFTIDISSQIWKQITSLDISHVIFDTSYSNYYIGQSRSVRYPNDIQCQLSGSVDFTQVSYADIIIKSIGLKNNQVPVHTIHVPIEDISNGSLVTFCDRLTKYVSDLSYADTSYNVSAAGTKFYLTQDKATFAIDVSVSATITNKHYKLYLFDPSGYAQPADPPPRYPTNTYIWANSYNMWYYYMRITDPSQNPYDLTPQIEDASYIDISFGQSPNIIPSKTAIITNENQINTLPELFGFTQNDYYYNQTFSKSFTGASYISNYEYPTIALDPSDEYFNNSITIHQYQSYLKTSRDACGNPTTATYEDIQTIPAPTPYDVSWSIGYKYITYSTQNTTKYSYYDIINAVNLSIQSIGVFTKDSKIWIVDASSNEELSSIEPTDISNIQTYKFKMNFRLDRKKVKNAEILKITQTLNHTIWTDPNYFNFIINQEITTPYDYTPIELSNIISETYVASNNISFKSTPYAYLRCIKPGYKAEDLSFSPTPYVNDVSFTVEPPSITSLGYSNTQYLNAINTGMSSKQSWGLTANVDNKTDEQNRAMMFYTINHVIEQVDSNNVNNPSNFIVDLSGTFFSNYNTEKSSWVFDSSKNIYTISTPQISLINNLDSSNNTIYIYSIGNSQKLTSKFEIPLTDDQGNPKTTFTIEELITKINKLFITTNAISLTDPSTNNVSLYGSSFEYDLTNKQITFNLFIRAKLQTKDYQLEFYDPSGSVTPPPPWNEDISNSWAYGLHLSDQSYNLSDPSSNDWMGVVGTNTVSVKGTLPINDKNLYLTSENNYFTLKPLYDASGGVYSGYNTQNDIIIEITDLSLNQYYNIVDIMNSVNKQFSIYSNNQGNVLYGSYIYVNSSNKTTIRMNINTVYTAKDYILDFYDPINFSHCTYGNASSVQTVTWDTTLGWILGFRSTQIYHLTPENVSYNPSLNYTYYANYVSNVYTYDTSTNIATITGDTSINVNLYNYFLIVLDDYVQNHLNDGLVTIASSALDIPLNSYTSRNTAYRCSSNMSTTNNSNETTYIGNVPDPITGNNKTANQLYSANQILNAETLKTKNPYQTSLGAYIKDIFGLVPIKTAGLTNGQSYIEFGGTLQIQERTYFGPVNIKRMTIRLLTDKGTILDLNNQNWSFSFIVQQLYNPLKPPKN